jgi:hypothetical protein
MGSETQLQKALKKLREGGAKIGSPETLDGQTVYRVDGVLLTAEKIFTMTQISPHSNS